MAHSSWAEHPPHLHRVFQVSNDPGPAGPRLKECNSEDGATLLLSPQLVRQEHLGACPLVVLNRLRAVITAS